MLKGPNGTVTIDEAAVMDDIRNLEIAKGDLENSIRCLDSVIAKIGTMQGNTANVIRENAEALKLQVQQSIGETDENITYLRNTLAKYQEIDRQEAARIRQLAEETASKLEAENKRVADIVAKNIRRMADKK